MISCKEYTEIKKREITNVVSSFISKGAKHPKLCVIQIGDNPASNSYIRGKKQDCKEVGVECEHIHINDYENVSQSDIVKMIEEKNSDESVDGIIIQLPIPKIYDVKALQKHISPKKDVDGFRRDSKYKPCTPSGIIDWLKFNNYDFRGKNAVVLGRSDIVGKPLVDMLIGEGATVVCCNSKTNPEFCMWCTQNSHLTISAVGIPRKFDHKYFSNKTQIVVDVGINRNDTGKLCGDICSEKFKEYLPNTYLTPVPNGVGKLTRIKLLENVVEAYRNHLSVLACG